MALPSTRFTFTHRALVGDTARLGYRLEGEGEVVEFEERFTLPQSVSPELAAQGDVQRALRGLHLMAGVSYWKATLAPELTVEGGGLTEEDAEYFTEVWSEGLGELFCRNEIDLARRPRFTPDAASVAHGETRGARPDEAYVLLGGGKDSAVSVEALRRAKVPATALSVGASTWIARAARVSGLSHAVIARRVDPALAALNARGAVNGHVPISAILAHATLLLATVTGVGSVVASNERSASFGNVVYQGAEVNHQWSKGLRFERILRDWCARNLPAGPRWLSLLRPMSELHIASRFAAHPRWFDDVTSCNANFRLDGRAAPERWCGRCPKCVFVYAITSPFLDDEGVARLFGRSFLADAENVPMAAALCGVEGHKPFECVGTPDESRAALWLASRRPRERDAAVSRWFRDVVALSDEEGAERVREAMTLSDDHALDPRWEAVLREYLAAAG
ncbi:MAG: hypothetical protein R3A48_14740 [Polyangiales bacterium]